MSEGGKLLTSAFKLQWLAYSLCSILTAKLGTGLPMQKKTSCGVLQMYNPGRCTLTCLTKTMPGGGGITLLFLNEIFLNPFLPYQ
jgi:hypothetical protein